MAGVLLWGYDATNKVWIPLQVDANGYVKVDLSNINLDDLADVSVATPGQGDYLYYDLVNSLWKSRRFDTGPTVPTSPLTGQLFLHTPTGRNVLIQYDGANWISIISLGTMTMYVDKTNGADAIDKGGGITTNAFQTIQYAIDRVPGLFGGNVIITATAETYDTEDIIIRGKNPTGFYTITIQGTWSEDVGESTATGGTAGTANTAAQATVTTSLNPGANDYAGKWIKFEDDTSTVALRGDIRIIESNTAGPNSTLSLVGGLDAAPANGDTFKIVHPGTTVGNGAGAAIGIREGQKAVTCTILTIASGQGLTISQFSSGTFSFIDSDQGSGTMGVTEKSRGNIDRCYIHGTAHGIICNRQSLILPHGCLIKGDGGANDWGIAVYDNSAGRPTTLANVIDNFGKGGLSSVGGVCSWQIGNVPNHVIRNCTIGILTQLNGVSELITDGNSVSYDTCGTDHSTATGGQET